MDHAGSNRVGRAELGRSESVRASRRWWDENAAAYLAEHGSFLGDRDGAPRFVWGPEGLTEDAAGLLGPVRGRRVLEVGCGAGQCGRWLRARGAEPIGVDLSVAMLRAGAALGASARAPVPVAQADAAALPLVDRCVDLACSAYGAVPFVADLPAVHREVARVLRLGGRWVFATTHPVRWAFPDDPGPAGLVADRSYFDRRAYVERDELGRPCYVEHHRTLGDHVRALTAAGFEVLDLVEPEWTDPTVPAWGGWSALRGQVLPGTAIWVARLPAR